jgi:hypothetical protein
LIDTPVVNNTNYSNERILAEILWELTFYGWTEKKVAKTWEDIGGKIKQAKKEFKEGKFIELSSTNDGKKIVIPESVQKQFDEIDNR